MREVLADLLSDFSYDIERSCLAGVSEMLEGDEVFDVERSRLAEFVEAAG